MDHRDGINNKSESAKRKQAYAAKKQKRRRIRIAIRLGVFVCMLAFIVGGVIAGKALIEDSRANSVYDGLRSQLQQTAYIHSVSAETSSAPAEAPAPADAPVPAEDEPAVVASAMDFSPLRQINDEIVAWLVCEGTAIDYPVLHAADNDYYLKHIYTKERNRMGSLFVDCRNTGLFTDRNTVIYGHNMKSGAMFHALSLYRTQEYYEAFPTMTLYTPGGDYTIELFAATVEDGNYEFVQFDFTDDAEYLAYIDSFRARSRIHSDAAVAPTDRIVTLCTCSYERNNARYVVMGKLLPG